jgi:hypothetical protein
MHTVWQRKTHLRNILGRMVPKEKHPCFKQRYCRRCYPLENSFCNCNTIDNNNNIRSSWVDDYTLTFRADGKCIIVRSSSGATATSQAARHSAVRSSSAAMSHGRQSSVSSVATSSSRTEDNHNDSSSSGISHVGMGVVASPTLTLSMSKRIRIPSSPSSSTPLQPSPVSSFATSMTTTTATTGSNCTSNKALVSPSGASADEHLERAVPMFHPTRTINFSEVSAGISNQPTEIWNPPLAPKKFPLPFIPGVRSAVVEIALHNNSNGTTVKEPVYLIRCPKKTSTSSQFHLLGCV